MAAARLIAEARRRAGLSQQQLAARVGTTQSAIARWESGRVAPSFDAVVRVVRGAGFELHCGIAAPDPDHDGLIADHLRMSPAERVEALQERVAADRLLRGAARR